MNALSLLLACAIAALTVNVAAADLAGRKLQHVVAFKFKDGTRPEQIAKVEVAFKELAKKVPGITGFEYGVNNSPEGKNKGCTHCFILSFNSEKDRDGYLPHPAHKEFGKLVGPLLADVFVLDFWAKE